MTTIGNHVALPSSKKQELVQKLEGAIQSMRRDRDHAYREKVEAEQRLRLACEEQEALQKIVMGLQDKHSKLLAQTNQVQNGLGPLEAQVQDLTGKVQFQHNELLGARAKIQDKTREMEARTKTRAETFQKIQSLGQERRLKFEATEKKLEQQLICEFSASSPEQRERLESQRNEGLERELSCLLFDWETMPQLLAERIKMLQKQFQIVKDESDLLVKELGRRGIRVEPDPESGTPSVGSTMQVEQDKGSVTPMSPADRDQMNTAMMSAMVEPQAAA